MRVIVGLGLGVLVAAGIAAAPAIGASSGDTRAVRHAAPAVHGIGSFTPASADPRLAAVLARASIIGSVNGFRFTPSEARGARAVTVAVRARSSRGVAEVERAATDSPVSLAPIAYNLGVAVGWKRFALSGDVTKVDLAGVPGSREGADVALSYSGARVSGRVKANAERPLTSGTPPLPGDVPSYSVDLGGSYSLTRNLDVTAGVRYRSDRDRLQRLEDTRRDSQAVYLGTAFRF